MKTVRNAFLTGIAFLLTLCSPVNKQKKILSELDSRARVLLKYAEKKGYSTHYCFLADMQMHSGLKRFFVYDLSNRKVLFSGLVAHGSCSDVDFLKEASFSNTPGAFCTSAGIYQVGSPYYGNYGKAYRLYGLQNSNSNAFKRAVVLHSYFCVPDEETYPKPICNSSGCPMVSEAFLKRLAPLIEQSDKPVLLWVYNKKVPL
jgi:L,D-transpeptidase catalytic domain